jgi:hypothetical protein
MSHKVSWLMNVMAILLGILIGLVIRHLGLGIRAGPRG